MIRSRVSAVVLSCLAVFLLGFGLTLVMKLRAAGEHAARENERRPRSMGVPQQWPDWFRNLDRNTDG